MGYVDRQYTGKTGVKELAPHLPVVVLDNCPLQWTNGGGGDTLSESSPRGRQEFQPPRGGGITISVPLLLYDLIFGLLISVRISVR